MGADGAWPSPLAVDHVATEFAAGAAQAAPIDLVALEASLGLHRRAPIFSAMPRASGEPGGGAARAMIGAGAGLGLLEPQILVEILALFSFGAFVLLVGWRFWLLLVATTPGQRHANPHMPGGNTSLPVYTILVPLYREAAATPGLARALCALDWPAERIDLILLLEAGDEETQRAVAACRWPMGMRTLVLPPGAPRTKPRALNYGLQFARGQLACIYDAEDRPHPGQLKAAYTAFYHGPPELACVQGPLVAHNHRESWLAGQWALEYAIQFGLLLPAQVRLGLPILLGGTSNHFRMSALRRLRGWDAWNVTEDADLGVRLARAGYRSGTISLPTFEEAPETLGIWTAQRSRWLKGFLQSWVVLARAPRGGRGELGLWGWLSLQIGLIGTCLAALAHGPLALATLAALLAGAVHLDHAGVWLLLAGYGVNALAGLAAPGPRGLRRWLSVATLPLYWPLHTLAALRALYGWLRAPHFWAKTPHGLSAASEPLRPG